MAGMFIDPFVTGYVLVVTALLGLVMGSFINCWAWRATHGESVLAGRSHCPSCGHVLGVHDLVPVFSWLAAGRKCRYCQAPVSARYPATELICTAVFVAIVCVYGVSLEALELWAFAGILLFLSLTDLDSFVIPNACIVAALAVRAAYLAVSFALGQLTLEQIGFFVASAFGVGAALLVVVLAADKLFGRDSMGGGDLKLFFVAAFYFGWQQALFLVIVSCVLGIVVAAVSMRAESRGTGSQVAPAASGATAAAQADSATSGTAALDATTSSAAPSTAQPAEGFMQKTIPFGPSIAAACVLTMLAGSAFISWYLAFL